MAITSASIELPKWVSDNLEMNASLTASSGNPYTPIKGRSYDWEQGLDGSRNENNRRYVGYVRR